MIIILGLGFGLPLIIGLPETVLTCGRQDFEDLIEDYGLERGLQPLLNEGYSEKDLKSIVKEFSILLPVKLRCIGQVHHIVFTIPESTNFFNEIFFWVLYMFSSFWLFVGS